MRLSNLYALNWSAIFEQRELAGAKASDRTPGRVKNAKQDVDGGWPLALNVTDLDRAGRRRLRPEQQGCREHHGAHHNTLATR
jgi:hypothetical protein